MFSLFFLQRLLENYCYFIYFSELNFQSMQSKGNSHYSEPLNITKQIIDYLTAIFYRLRLLSLNGAVWEDFKMAEESSLLCSPQNFAAKFCHFGFKKSFTKNLWETNLQVVSYRKGVTVLIERLFKVADLCIA